MLFASVLQSLFALYKNIPRAHGNAKVHHSNLVETFLFYVRHKEIRIKLRGALTKVGKVQSSLKHIYFCICKGESGMLIKQSLFQPCIHGNFWI